jgi:hypothetical protein
MFSYHVCICIKYFCVIYFILPLSKELRSLTSSGDHGGWWKNDQIQWTFDYSNKTLPWQLLLNVTPAATSTMDNNDNSIESNDDEITVSLLEQDNACAAHQNVTHLSTDCTLKGNQLVDVQSLANVLNEVSVCKKCSKKNDVFMSAFFVFCEEEHEEVMQSTVRSPLAQPLEIYAVHMNTRILNKKWCGHYSPSNALVPKY